MPAAGTCELRSSAVMSNASASEPLVGLCVLSYSVGIPNMITSLSLVGS